MSDVHLEVEIKKIHKQTEKKTDGNSIGQIILDIYKRQTTNTATDIQVQTITDTKKKPNQTKWLKTFASKGWMGL